LFNGPARNAAHDVDAEFQTQRVDFVRQWFEPRAPAERDGGRKAVFGESTWALRTFAAKSRRKIPADFTIIF
jgi:hypothetical protein